MSQLLGKCFKINLILIIINCNFIYSFHSPCYNSYNGNNGYCVPKVECCSSNYRYSLRQFDCKANELCCPGSIFCQSCEEGYKKVNDSCVDINECDEKHGLCSGHKCINTLGGYECECFESFQMKGETKTCKHMNDTESAELLFGASLTINLMPLKQSKRNIQMLYSGTVRPESIDYSFDGNYMAWNDIELRQIDIIPINKKNASLIPNRQTIKRLKMPKSLSIDWIHDLIYWLDLETRTINVVNVLHPEYYYEIINITSQESRDIVVNVLDSCLVWTNIGSNPRIMRSLQDGSKQSTLYSSMKQIFCLTIDVFLKSYYFIDIEDFSLYSIDFKGENERKIFSSKQLLIGINSMSVYNDNIFVSTIGVIYKFNKFGIFNNQEQKAEAVVTSLSPNFLENSLNEGSNVKSYRKELFGFKIIDPLLQPLIESKCRNSQCSHICLPSDDKQIFRCLCPKHYVLTNNSICIEKRFENLIKDSIDWENDLQKLINESINKSNDLRKLLNQSFSQQIDLNTVFKNLNNGSEDMKQMFDLMANQTIEMKKSLKMSLNETMFWKTLLNGTLKHKQDLDLLLNQSIEQKRDSNQLFDSIFKQLTKMTQIFNLTKSEVFLKHLDENENSVEKTSYVTEGETRVGEQVIQVINLMALLSIFLLLLFIGLKLNSMKAKETNHSFHFNPLFRKSQEINSLEEMESKT